MKREKPKTGIRKGMTLIEVMVAAVIIVISVLGAMMYRYHSALDARKADVKIGAARVALLLLEGWKGMAGISAYDPTDISYSSPDVSVTKTTDVSGKCYKVALTGGTGTTYYTRLTTVPDSFDGTTKELRVEVFWNKWGTATATNYSEKLCLKDWTYQP